MEVILGEEKSKGEVKIEQQKKEKEQASAKIAALSKLLESIGGDELLKDYKASVEKDLATAKKASTSKSKAVQLEAKAAFIDREAKRLTELEADILKAQDALTQRTATLAAEKISQQTMKEELMKGAVNPAGQMDVDSEGLDALERRELELLRNLSANFQADGKVINLADSKRLAKDLEVVQKDIESKRRRTDAPAAQGS